MNLQSDTPDPRPPTLENFGSSGRIQRSPSENRANPRPLVAYLLIAFAWGTYVVIAKLKGWM